MTPNMKLTAMIVSKTGITPIHHHHVDFPLPDQRAG